MKVKQKPFFSFESIDNSINDVVVLFPSNFSIWASLCCLLLISVDVNGFSKEKETKTVYDQNKNYYLLTLLRNSVVQLICVFLKKGLIVVVIIGHFSIIILINPQPS